MTKIISNKLRLSWAILKLSFSCMMKLKLEFAFKSSPGGGDGWMVDKAKLMLSQF